MVKLFLLVVPEARVCCPSRRDEGFGHTWRLLSVRSSLSLIPPYSSPPGEEMKRNIKEALVDSDYLFIVCLFISITM